jgi:transposase InsO family protein
MSRKDTCCDDAVAESFFATLKTELIYPRRFATRAEVRETIVDFMEGFDNPRRRHSTLGYLSPIDLEVTFLEKKMCASCTHAA